MKKVLIISHYYPPEMGAASNRIHQLAKGLNRNFEVTVLSPLPNYPEGRIFNQYRGKLKDSSYEDGIRVIRLWILPSNSKNKAVRFLSMLSYSLSLMFYFVFNAIPKRVIIQSPPLLVAFTSIFFLRSRHRKLVLNVSDLWPDAALNLGAVKEGLVYSTLKRMESFNYRNAHLILGQSNEILQHVKRITVYPKLMLYRNFPRIKIMDDASKPPKTSYTIRIVYAGLIGVAQGVVELCQHLNFQGIEFHIYGSGPETASLKAFIASHPNLPILYHGRIERQALHRKLMTYDVAIVPLVKRIYGSVPSKIFELAALGIPMIYFGGGEGEGIVSDHALGWVVNPQDYKQLNATIQEEVKPNLFKFNKSSIRAISLKHFNYDTQLQELKKELL